MEDEDSGSESTVSAEDRDMDSTCTMCTVRVMPGVQLSTLDTFADMTSSRHHPLKLPHLHERECCFLMIQLLSCLKYIQSQGVEEVSSDLDSFILFLPRYSASFPQLLLLWESLFNLDEEGCELSREFNTLTLCQCALGILCMLLHTEVPTEEILREQHVPLFSRITPYSEGFQKVAEILRREKASSLTQAKAILDYMFWLSCAPRTRETESDSGSSMAASGSGTSLSEFGLKQLDSEFAARLWLDGERAKTVNNIVKSVIETGNSAVVDLTEEYRVDFLLHASAKQLFDAAASMNSSKDVVV